MDSQQTRRFESFAARLDAEPELAQRFQQSPGATLSAEGVLVGPVAAEAGLLLEPAPASMVTDAASHRSEFTFTNQGVFFWVTSKEASVLTIGGCGQLIREAYDRLSDEQKEWVQRKLDGLEAGMVIGILVWKEVGRSCPNRLVYTFSYWPRWNPLWTPPTCT